MSLTPPSSSSPSSSSSSTNPPISIESLDDDVLTLILRFLPAYDLCTSTNLSRRFLHLTSLPSPPLSLLFRAALSSALRLPPPVLPQPAVPWELTPTSYHILLHFLPRWPAGFSTLPMVVARGHVHEMRVERDWAAEDVWHDHDKLMRAVRDAQQRRKEEEDKSAAEEAGVGDEAEEEEVEAVTLVSTAEAEAMEREERKAEGGAAEMDAEEDEHSPRWDRVTEIEDTDDEDDEDFLGDEDDDGDEDGAAEEEEDGEDEEEEDEEEEEEEEEENEGDRARGEALARQFINFLNVNLGIIRAARPGAAPELDFDPPHIAWQRREQNGPDWDGPPDPNNPHHVQYILGMMREGGLIDAAALRQRAEVQRQPERSKAWLDIGNDMERVEQRRWNALRERKQRRRLRDLWARQLEGPRAVRAAAEAAEAGADSQSDDETQPENERAEAERALAEADDDDESEEVCTRVRYSNNTQGGDRAVILNRPFPIRLPNHNVPFTIVERMTRQRYDGWLQRWERMQSSSQAEAAPSPEAREADAAGMSTPSDEPMRKKAKHQAQGTVEKSRPRMTAEQCARVVGDSEHVTVCRLSMLAYFEIAIEREDAEATTRREREAEEAAERKRKERAERRQRRAAEAREDGAEPDEDKEDDSDDDVPQQAQYRFAEKVECISIGLANASFSLTSKQPGWDKHSWGYHGDDGAIFHGSGQGSRGVGTTFGAGDVVGCGLDYRTGRVFFTRNGEFIASMTAPSQITGEWFGVVGLDSPAVVRVSTRGPWAFDLAGYEHGELVLENSRLVPSSTASFSSCNLRKRSPCSTHSASHSPSAWCSADVRLWLCVSCAAVWRREKLKKMQQEDERRDRALSRRCRLLTRELEILRGEPDSDPMNSMLEMG